jgi:glycosyltransferase involved in cell wall biosynthesis
LALMLWQKSVLAGATLLHATSDLEVGSIRAAGFRNPVCLIPNGIDPPTTHADRSEHGPRRCVFLSRIHPKKGLPLLLEAWARLKPVRWTLEIAGHSEDHAHEAALRRMIEERRLAGVRLVGERSGADKWAFLGEAHLFILPSYSENFGIVVAEAMAAGLPVIATTGTPWRVLADSNLGWCVDPSIDAITAALQEAMAAPQSTLTQRGMRAREFALAEFGWPEISRRMAACYRWMLGLGPATSDILFT